MTLVYEFKPSGRGKAQCAPNPAYPNGIDIDISEGKDACLAELPYPAPECGAWIVSCPKCGTVNACTAAGRPDDPRTFTMPCKAETK